MIFLNKLKMSFALTVLVALFLVACGDSLTEDVIKLEASVVVADVSDLPECEDDNEGVSAFVKSDESVRVCIDGKWLGADTVYAEEKLDCSVKELSDKSGVKIICNGDSVGVAKNGKKGESGKAGEDGSDGENGKDGSDGEDCSVDSLVGMKVKVSCGNLSTIMDLSQFLKIDSTSDEEKIPVSLDSLTGYLQKGPFVKGATVYLYELENGYTLKQTNGNFVSSITRDDGRYKFMARNLVSQYVMLVVEGNYRNEVTGDVSANPIRLKAISNMRLHKTANVNILTHLEFERVYHLVTKEKLTVLQAKRKAQKEILSQFYITLDESTDAEDMDVFGKSDADAALLALSILLQGNRNEADLTVLLTELQEDLVSDGKWKRVDSLASLADWALEKDSDRQFELYRDHVEKWFSNATVPNFERDIRRFASLNSGLGICGTDVAVGTVKNVTNEFSKYYSPTYADTAGDWSRVRFVCADSVNSRWRLATEIEKDTVGWGKNYESGAVRNGIVNSGWTYVFENNTWRHGTALDSLLGIACTEARLGDTSTVKYADRYYVCTAQSNSDTLYKWESAPDIYNTTFEARKECNADGKYNNGSLLVSLLNKDSAYVCDADTFRVATENEMDLEIACVSYLNGKDFLFEGILSYYQCTEKGWKFNVEKNSGKLVDLRDNKEYRTIRIGTMELMAENLAYEYKVKEYGTSDSIAYGCDYYVRDSSFGRYYTWAAALDSAAIFSENGKGCGYGAVCEVNEPARGVCPEGWHIPTMSEWYLLQQYSTIYSQYFQEEGFSLWPKANDYFGFSAKPAGLLYYGSRYTDGMAFYWSSTDMEDNWLDDTPDHRPYSFCVNASGWVSLSTAKTMDYGMSVRCFKDE